MNPDDTLLKEVINETPKRGPFSFTNEGKCTWQCPFCDHALAYSAMARDAAELAANSHVSRQHKRKKLIVMLPDTGAGINQCAPRPESSQQGREDSPRQR